MSLCETRNLGAILRACYLGLKHEHLAPFSGLFWVEIEFNFFTLMVNEQVVRNCESGVRNCPVCVCSMFSIAGVCQTHNARTLSLHSGKPVSTLCRDLLLIFPGGGGVGVLPYIRYRGMCRPIG